MDQPSQRNRFWNGRRRLWAAAAALALAVLAAAGHWLPDWGLRYGLVRSLRELGWPQVSVRDADLSLFNGAIVVRRVQAGENLGKMLGIDGLDLRFRWKPLFSRRVSVERLDLSGVDIDIRRQGGELVVNGLPLVATGGDGGGSSWRYDVTALTLTDSRIHLVDGALAADIQVDRLELDDLKSWEPEQPLRYRLGGRVNGAPVELSGTATPFAARPGFAAHVAVTGFDLGALAELARGAGAGVPAGRLSGDVELSGGAGAPLTASGTVDLADGGWASGSTRLGAERLTLALSRLRWENGGLAVAGTAAADGMRLEDGGVAVTAAALRLAAEDAAWDGKRPSLSWRGTLHADRHAVAIDDIRIEHGSLDWRGATRFDFAAAAPSFVHAEGRAEVGGLKVAVGELTAEATRLSAEGLFEHARPDGMLPPLAGRMDVAADQLRVRAPGQDWLHADRVEARELKLTPGAKAALTRLEARGVTLLARTGKDSFPARLEARHMVLDRASLAADGSASAAGLTLAGALGRITRTKTGFLGMPEPVADSAGVAAPAAPMPRVVLGRLRIGEGSRLEFRDRTLAEPVRLRLDDVDLNLSDLDSARPDADSPFSLRARIGVAQLAAQGRLRPFAAEPAGEVKGSVRALELPSLSPYAANTLGVHLQTGQLDAEITLAATQGKLDGGMQLTLSELFIAQPDPNAPLAKSADMPVETILDLLRDSENRIRLSIPVRGDLANPDFDISDAVGQAVGGALKSTMFTTLKVAFPLAGLISLVIDDSESRRLALEPLAFAPGADALGEGERRRLGAVATLMAEKPGLRLTLCGVATQGGDAVALAERRRPDEGAGLLARLQKLVGPAAPSPAPLTPAQEHDRLVRLADARAQAAKAFLVDQSGIDPGRLFTCRPRVESEAQSVPRVDLVL